MGSNPGEEMPTRKNITAAMNWLVQKAVPGDSLLFYYSGHGCQRPNRNRKEKDGFDEAIVPCAGSESCFEDRAILDDEMNRLLVQQLPEGVRLTVILDCCHSGSGMDLAYNWDPYAEDRSGSWTQAASTVRRTCFAFLAVKTMRLRSVCQSCTISIVMGQTCQQEHFRLPCGWLWRCMRPNAK